MAFVFAFNIVMPIAALCMDRKAYNIIKDMDDEDRKIVNGIARN